MYALPEYVKIKDNYLICYWGPALECLLLLKLIRPFIARRFPDLNLYLCCRDEHYHILDGTERSLKMSQLKSVRKDFAHIKEIRFGGTHPIEQFLKENHLKLPPLVSVNDPDRTVKTVIITKSCYPTKNLSSDQLATIKRMLTGKGYQIHIDSDVDNAGLVVGVESYPLFKAASEGVSTKLVPTGVGTQLYLNLFPKGELLHI